MNANWLHPVLIEPTDTLFFRDSIPMSAGQGRGAGARLPLPSTLHESVRASLFEQHGRSDTRAAFRPREAPRTGGWLGHGKSVPSSGSKDFQSLQIAGPLPYLEERNGEVSGLLFPVPLDVVFAEDGSPHTLSLLYQCTGTHSAPLPALAVSPIPPRKDQPSGFVTARGMQSWVSGTLDQLSADAVVKSSALFAPEYRIGVALDPARNAAAESQLYSATHARPDQRFRMAAWMGLKKPVNGEEEKLAALDFLLLGGEQRLARMHRAGVSLSIPSAPAVRQSDAPALLKWALATPAVFAHGWMPGWCRDSRQESPIMPDGYVCLPLPGRARLIASCLGKPLAFAGWDTVEEKSKPTQLAVPAGSVYYFLCENAATAAALAGKLHWQPRSDVFGEKGFGYGLVSFDVNLHPTSTDIPNPASSLNPT